MKLVIVAADQDQQNGKQKTAKSKGKSLTLKQHKSCFTQKKQVTVVLYKRSAKYSKNDDVVQPHCRYFIHKTSRKNTKYSKNDQIVRSV